MELADVMAMLGRTPGVLDRLLEGVPARWLHRTDGPGTWSAYDIAGHLHLADTEGFLPRARVILAHGASESFVAFDREAMLGREPEPVEALLARFAESRQACLDALGALNLTAADMERRGQHPEFGEVTLGQLLATWVAHDLTHVGQIGEVLAREYRDDVGPWRAYMPALDRVAEAE